jgi:hypothetical protein
MKTTVPNCEYLAPSVKVVDIKQKRVLCDSGGIPTLTDDGTYDWSATPETN